MTTTPEAGEIALAVPCPRCDAPAGVPCTSSEGIVRGTPHRRRIYEAALHTEAR